MSTIGGFMQYRLLVRGEEIQTTDEYLTDDTVTWNPVTDNFAGRAFIGKDWNPIIMQLYSSGTVWNFKDGQVLVRWDTSGLEWHNPEVLTRLSDTHLE
jgi:hypothetical protein